MGSQTLEILRQGVWASLTGGWFYDPHQNLFCNTVHLYIWLFLLCVPFSIYLYFPPASLGWGVYCGLVALLFIALKLLNHSLHHMYDTTECVVVHPPASDDKNSNENTNVEEGVEMQMLRLGGAGSDNESVTSLEYHKPNNSTIDLKVDVHRKNSSESSVEESTSTKPSEAVSKAELCAPHPVPNRARHPRQQRSKREHRPGSARKTTANRIDELIVDRIYREEASRNPRQDRNFPLHLLSDDGPFAKVSRTYQECSHRRGSSNRDFFKEWLYLDGSEANGEPYRSKFARQLSSDSRDTSEPNVGPPSPKKRTPHRRRYANYQDESCTKSAMALATAQSSNMRRNSNSTMSTIQLPLLNSTAQLVSHMRRHSNNADTGFFASVELGEYMKTEAPNGDPDKSKSKSPGVRRIKSAALEIGCPPPSVSNLSPHPNSAETIGGQMLKNPKSAVIPPPSKSLTRGPHLNLYPKNESGEGCSYPYLTYGSEIVYPIAEISDEMQTSQKETDLDSSGDSYSDYEDEKQFRGFDWDAEQSPPQRSSDSDYENNGSRSPLLDRTAEVRVVRSKNQDKRQCCERHSVSKSNVDCPNEKVKSSRQKKVAKSETQPETKRSERQTSNCECKSSANGDYFDKASASSKDLLIEKSSLESNENPEVEMKSETKKNMEKKLWDHDISNSSSSSDSNSDRPPGEVKVTKIPTEPEESQLTGDSKSADERSVYSLDWLFEETPPRRVCIEDGPCTVVPHEVCQRLASALGESSSNVPKNLGAIPKQTKNLARSRASSQKENKKRDSKKEKDGKQNEERILMDAVEAQAALVQGLECLFAATNANTVVMPTNREDRPRSHRQSLRGERENSHKTRKRSIEEVAQTSTNTLLPTSMPLLAAFLNSRVDFVPCGQENAQPESTTSPAAEEGPRLRPLMDRNHRNRVRKIKRSTRQRNNPPSQANTEKRPSNPETSSNSSNVHFATSFDDTSEGAIHCFMDEYGNWMSYTFDKNCSGRSQAQPIPLPDKEDSVRLTRVKPVNRGNSQETGEGSSVSLESETGNSESIAKTKRGDSVDHSSSNQGSSNALLSSNNNVSTVVPINTNASNKRFYVFDGGTGSHNDQPRSPVAYVTDSLLEQIEAERQSRMGLPSMHINFLMSQQRAQQQAQQQETASANIPSLMPSIGEESVEINIRSKFSKLMDEIEKANQPKPKSYYKYKLWKFLEVKITMDRLKLMALFDRSLSYKESFISILLAILVAFLGSTVLSYGFYKDIYAFWFCFIMAGSQYSLLKSVQPDSASPVHGFNKIVVFSRPVYFCLCTGILCIVHSYLGETGSLDEHSRSRRSADEIPITIYGFRVNERDFLYVIQQILSTFILFFPLAFSLGLFPQVNTFLMYLLEQIDMHIFGGNATCSLSAAVYCVARSLAAVGVLYGFAYSGLVEGKKSEHQKHNVLFSIFCGLLVAISYHLSRSASDYSLIWNLIKKHLLPPELYVIHNPECAPDLEKTEPVLTEEKKNNSESNISKQNSIGSSASKINFSSESNIAKTQKRSQTSSVSSLKMDLRGGDTINSTNSLRAEPTAEETKSKESLTNNPKQEATEKPEEDMEDPLPRKLQETVNARLKNDVIVCTFLALFIFGLHCTTVFTTLKPQLNKALWIITGCVGWVLHYWVPQLRKQQPWLCLSGPVLRMRERQQFEPTGAPQTATYEKIFVYLCFVERNVALPLVVVGAATAAAPSLADKLGDSLAALALCVASLKCLRHAYSEPDSQYLIIVFAVLLFQRDWSTSETFLIDYFVTAIIYSKMYELLLKVQFVVTYIAPWQITWGSAFHAFAQPFSVPHSGALFVQAIISAVLSSPLTPALGSAIFMTSYVRPVKFWERDYNTKRVDQSNTRLSSQLERNLGADDNNLNSIFYEHLTRSLQHYLCGDLALGRWGKVTQGDCFVLASDYLNCLVHIVETGNGLVSFQLRGLEFRGTYCQQREVEAISEGPEDNSEGVCGGWWCGACGGALLAPGTAWTLRWLAWQLASARYVLEGYSVSDNSAISMLQVFDFRKLLLTYYVKSIIYYTLQSPKLEEWLSNPVLVEALKPMGERSFVDLDPIFNVNLDEDYDFRASGITRSRFCAIYQDWVLHCARTRGAGWRRRCAARDSALVTLCFALALLGRRALASAHHPLAATSVEFFLYGLHALFKGDFRITCARDEWVFTDVSLLHSVLAPAVRMALKLHQDHFMFPEEYCSSEALYAAITSHSQRLVICHEAAPAWRYNVLRGAPHLLALRHVMDEGNVDDYKIIMLNKRHLGFRVIKLNRECVRGLWAGQQQELVYLRNRNPERGSIQNAKQALRNIINSSCDQPIGYPIYVSPLTTSYSDTSPPLTELLGSAITGTVIKNKLSSLWQRIRRRCGEGCSSGAGAEPDAEAGVGARVTHTPPHTAQVHLTHADRAGTRGSLASSGIKPASSTLASLAGLLRDHANDRHQEHKQFNVYGSAPDTRRSEERAGSGGRRERHARARSSAGHAARQTSGRRAARRERPPASFRLLCADTARPVDTHSDNPLQGSVPKGVVVGTEPSVRESDSHTAGSFRYLANILLRLLLMKLNNFPTEPTVSRRSSEGSVSAGSSIELSVSGGGDVSLPDCRIIANQSARQTTPHRYYVAEGTSKDLSKPSKEIRHERESYRELTGRYIEKPETIALKETHYSDLSSKETGLKKEAKKEKIKTKIKRSDSGKSELRINVSVGSKVLIVEPLGVYDCINLGRRIDVQWPSEQQRERGGRNYWGAWVPSAGMDGLVVHKWSPNHRDPRLRSHVDKTILLVQIDDKFVPIAENCVQDLGDEV